MATDHSGIYQGNPVVKPSTKATKGGVYNGEPNSQLRKRSSTSDGVPEKVREGGITPSKTSYQDTAVRKGK